jgi:hypothetical protein
MFASLTKTLLINSQVSRRQEMMTPSRPSIDEGYATVSRAESDNYSLYYHTYNKDDPKIPLIESLQGKTNFFEKCVSKYAKSGVTTKETTLERRMSHPTLQ